MKKRTNKRLHGVAKDYVVIYVARGVRKSGVRSERKYTIQKTRIYTVDTFFETMKFLEPQKALAWLAELNTQSSPILISNTMFRPNGILVEYANTRYARSMIEYSEGRANGRRKAIDDMVTGREDEDWEQFKALNGLRKQLFLRALVKQGNRFALEELRQQEEQPISQKIESQTDQQSGS